MISPAVPSTIREGLHAELIRATGLRVEIENDANAAAYGEFKVGAGQGSRDIFYMMIGKGIGGAIILDGKLWTGSWVLPARWDTSRLIPKAWNASVETRAVSRQSHLPQASCDALVNDCIAMPPPRFPD